MIGEQVPVQQEQEVHGTQRSHEKEFLVEHKQCYDNTIGKKKKYHLHFDKRMSLHLLKKTNVEFPLPKVLCTKFSWNWLIGSGEDFLELSTYFHYVAIISP